MRRKAVQRIKGSVNRSSSAPVIPHKRFMVSNYLQRMLNLPTIAAIILKAGYIPAEIRTLFQKTVTDNASSK